MKALILSFRRGRHTQKTNQFLLELPGVNSREKAAPFIGKKVSWISPALRGNPKEITGIITHHHGNNGVLRARFSRGLPGTAIRNSVTIKE